MVPCDCSLSSISDVRSFQKVGVKDIDDEELFLIVFVPRKTQTKTALYIGVYN